MGEIKVEGGQLIQKEGDPDVFQIAVFSEGNYKIETEKVQRLDKKDPEDAQDGGEVRRHQIEETLKLTGELISIWEKDRHPSPSRLPAKGTHEHPNWYLTEMDRTVLDERVGQTLAGLLIVFTPVREIFFDRREEVYELLK
jgi:hypothetical protein